MELTRDILNRVRVWDEALKKGYSYLLAIENLGEIGTEKSDYIIYKFGERNGIFHQKLTLKDALIDASLIHFYSIFSAGYSGNLMAGNKDDQIECVRKQVISKTIESLNWSQAEYELFFKSITDQRNGLLAHYDGNVGDYKEELEGLYSRKMVGASLLDEDINKFKSLVKELLVQINKIAWS